MNHLYNIKVDVIRITKIKEGGLGSSESESVLHRNLPCRISWSSGSEKIQFNKDTYYRDGKLFCNVVDITVEDRIRFNGVIYEIVDVEDPHNMGRFLKLQLKLKQE